MRQKWGHANLASSAPIAELNSTTQICFLNKKNYDKDFLNEVDNISGGLLKSINKHPKYLNLKNGNFFEIPLAYGNGIESLIIVKLLKKSTKVAIREVGAKLANLTEHNTITMFTSDTEVLTQVTFGFELHNYSFDKYKSLKIERVKKLNILSVEPEIFKKNYIVSSILSFSCGEYIFNSLAFRSCD